MWYAFINFYAIFQKLSQRDRNAGKDEGRNATETNVENILLSTLTDFCQGEMFLFYVYYCFVKSEILISTLLYISAEIRKNIREKSKMTQAAGKKRIAG